MPVDPALFDMMHGVTPTKRKELPKKNQIGDGPFDDVIEKSIQEEVDLMLSNQDPSQNRFLTPQARRAKLEQELRESLDMPEFDKHLETATNILRNEGNKYLEKEGYDLLIEGLNNLNNQLLSLNPTNLNDESLKAALTLTPTNLSSILNIGIAKFGEGLMPESLSILIFLCALDAEEPDYWYRLGLISQKCEHYDLALRAFALTALLAPEFIGTHIFAAECYLKTGQRDDAVAEINEMKRILETSQIDEEWQKRVVDIENLLAAAIPIEGN